MQKPHGCTTGAGLAQRATACAHAPAAAQVDPAVQKLYDYIISRGTILPITDYKREYLCTGDVSKLIQARALLSRRP